MQSFAEKKGNTSGANRPRAHPLNVERLTYYATDIDSNAANLHITKKKEKGRCAEL